MKRLVLCLLPLGLAGCIQISNPAMPADWPALRPLSSTSELDGTYRGDKRQLAEFAHAFFFQNYYRWFQSFDGIRLSARPGELRVDALSGDTVLETRTLGIQFADGAVTNARKTSGHEGPAAATYNYIATLQLNAAGDLVARFHSTAVGLLLVVPAASSRTEWYRIPRATPRA